MANNTPTSQVTTATDLEPTHECENDVPKKSEDAIKIDDSIEDELVKPPTLEPVQESLPADIWITEQDPNETVNNHEAAVPEQCEETQEPQSPQEPTPEFETPAEDHQPDPQTSKDSKVSGYLGKKGKLRMVSSWKKYWFVLEGRLLLYYRSKAEYDSLSPCKGSITLGSPCNIKPGSASNCVFQIETRNHTVFLRADDRAEQEKWMRAILTALKQTSKATRMSHFRNSADDLALRTPSEKIPALIRQNTLPDRIDINIDGTQMAKEIKVKTMVQRIESLGGQSYIAGQNLNAPEHMKASKASPKLPKNGNLQKILGKQLDLSAVGDQGDWIKDDEISVENDLYSTFNAAKDSHIYQEIPVDERVEPVVIDENATNDEIDHNKNKVEYWEPIYDLAVPVYGDGETVEPSLPPRPAPQESVEGEVETEKTVRKGAKMRKRPSFVKRIFNKITRHESSVKDEAKDKRESRKSASVETSEKEVVESSAGEAIVPDQVLDQVPDINAHENGADLSPRVIEELNGVIRAKDEENKTVQNKHILDGEDDENPAKEQKSEPASPQLDQLTQLQLPQLPLKQKQSEQPKTEPTVESNDKTDEGKPINHSDFDYDLYDPSQRLNIPRPKLISKPKRQKRLKVSSDIQLPTVRFYQQYRECEEFREQVVSRLKEDNKLMTIDEILDDLENHNYEPFSRQKVKELIEKFNDTEHETDEDTKDEEQIHVQLRRKRVEQSEELNSLLLELSQVANAPLSASDSTTEGDNVTFSGEWKSLVAIRKRRHSDPDYDIPRPHSALQIIPCSEKEETRMQPTRFFGPVIIEPINGDTTSCGTSITPDSLEVDVLSYQAKNYTPSIEEDRSMRSYTSHIYASNDSHLNNNNIAQNSHTNQKPNSGGDNGADHNKDDQYTKSKSLSTLIVPKTESEQAFYLNSNSDKNNNSKKLIALVQNNDATKTAPVVEQAGENISSSVCYDSLEPSAVGTQE